MLSAYKNMEGLQCCGRMIRQLHRISKLRVNSLLARKCSTEKCSNDEIKDVEKQQSGFAKAYQKFEALRNIDNVSDQLKPRSFASLLRYSKFIDLGDPEGKIVTGEIFNVVGNDLYIDFGWKFHCVCPTPKKNSSKYIRGSKVNLRIKSLELSTRFLGSTTDLTILEADCVLLGLISSPLEH